MSRYLNYGKQHYFDLFVDAGEFTCLYNIDDVLELLREKFLGRKLSKAYVDLDGYLESFHNNDYLIDLSYMGGITLLVFERECIQLMFHCEGMLRYRCFPIWDMRVRPQYDYPSDDMALSGKYVIDAASHFVLPYEGATVSDITVKGTDIWCFSQPFFDEEKADYYAAQNKLPNEIIFHLSNGNELYLMGDSIEYYHLGVRKTTAVRI